MTTSYYILVYNPMNYDGGYGVQDAQLLDEPVEETTDSAAIIKQRNQAAVSSVLLH